MFKDPQPSAQPASTNQDGQVRSLSNVQPAASSQTVQTAAAVPSGVVSKRYQFQWYHALYGIAVLAASGTGTTLLVKKAIIPKLKSWICKVGLEAVNETLKEVDLKPNPSEEAAAAAAADVAKASQEMLNSRNQEKRYFEEFTNMLDVQVREMRSMSNSIRKLEGCG